MKARYLGPTKIVRKFIDGNQSISLGVLTKETVTTYHFLTSCGNSAYVSKRPIMGNKGVVLEYYHLEDPEEVGSKRKKKRRAG